MSTNVNFKDNSKEVLNDKQKAIKIALESIGIQAENFAKKDCPVDTGRLRNSIANQVEDNTVYIGTNVEYAEKIEYKAHFLRDAATTHGDLYRSIVEKALKGSAL